jgi:transcriptional/translational regulatory protein YebC/TACO1
VAVGGGACGEYLRSLALRKWAATPLLRRILNITIMSGHSKWHNIQKTKGAADAKRSQAFTKIAREMIVAVKEGGSGDPDNNSRLATVITKAKAANMPNDNIKRTIEKALGSGNADNYEHITYEGYGPSGVAVIVDAMTDNRNRTASEVRHGFDKYNGNMGAIRLRVLVLRQKGRHRHRQRGRRAGRGQGDDGRAGRRRGRFRDRRGPYGDHTEPDDVSDVANALEEKGYPSSTPRWRWYPRTGISSSPPRAISKNMERCWRFRGQRRYPERLAQLAQPRRTGSQRHAGCADILHRPQAADSRPAGPYRTPRMRTFSILCTKL